MNHLQGTFAPVSPFNLHRYSTTLGGIIIRTLQAPEAHRQGRLAPHPSATEQQSSDWSWGHCGVGQLQSTLVSGLGGCCVRHQNSGHLCGLVAPASWRKLRPLPLSGFRPSTSLSPSAHPLPLLQGPGNVPPHSSLSYFYGTSSAARYCASSHGGYGEGQGLPPGASCPVGKVRSAYAGD